MSARHSQGASGPARMQAEPTRFWLFDDFVAGREVGTRTEALDDALLQQLRAVYGSAAHGTMSSAESAALAMVLMMRAYIAIVAPRPPGNGHARQRFRLETQPSMDELLRITVLCHGKEVHRERRYVDFQAIGTGRGGRSIFTGMLTLIWAA